MAQRESQKGTDEVEQLNEDNAVEIRVPARLVNDDHLRMIGKGTGDAFQDAMAIAEGLYGEIKSFADEIGNGFAILEDKAVLVNMKCVFLTWSAHSGDYGNFVSAAVVTADGGKYIVNDGSTGLGKQLMEYTQRTGRNGGCVAPHGLRESSYSTCVGCGKPRDSREDECENRLDNGSVCGNVDTKRGTGSTFYIDASA